MKKVLFVTTRLIYPINEGSKVVLYNYCKGLAEQHGCEVRLFSLVNDEENNIEQPQFIKKVYKCNLPNNIEKAKNLITKSILSNKWPLQVSLYYSKQIKNKLNEVINEYQPDIVIADMARTAEYLKDLDNSKFNKILDMVDILSKRYRRQVKSGLLGSDAIGAYSKYLPTTINKLIDNGNIMKFILNKEVKLLEKYEIEIAKSYRSIVFVSPVEAEEFNNLTGNKKSIDITIGVDYEYFSNCIVDEKKENYIVFLGNMYVAHNKDAVKLFIKNIFPEILKENPKCIFRIVGRCSEEYKKEIEQYDNVEITGEVDDIRKYVQDCTIAVAPLVYGSGIKTKILETMAMGVPVVTNDIGCEGLKLKNNKEIIIENNNHVLAKKINDLLKNGKLREELSLNGQLYIKENHNWNNILERFSNII